MPFSQPFLEILTETPEPFPTPNHSNSLRNRNSKSLPLCGGPKHLSPKLPLSRIWNITRDKILLKVESPHHISFQNFNLLTLPTLKEVLLLIMSHPLLMVFHYPITILTFHSTPAPLLLPILPNNNHHPKWLIFGCKPPQPLSRKCLIKNGKLSNTKTSIKFLPSSNFSSH